jgi:23S rRNA pseudouridine955/2504/2580 synthase/23S rRNA pseudouridine1911/1915/1917 synthase
VRAANGLEAAPARTAYATVDVSPVGAVALLAVSPATGRTHQIRVHASHAGAPLLGDTVYGGPARVTLPNGAVVALARVFLHAARVVVPSRSGAPLVVDAPLPAELERVWASLGGAARSWDTAVECSIDAPAPSPSAGDES